MATKAKIETVEVEETIARLEAEIDQLDAELAEVIKTQPSGLSTRMVEIIDQARATGAKLTGARSDQASQQESLAQVEKMMDALAADRRRREQAGFLVNKALLLAASAFNLEHSYDEKADNSQEQIDSFVRQVDRDNHAIGQVVNGYQRALASALESELTLAAQRFEVLGTSPSLPPFVSSALNELHRLFRKAGGVKIDARFYNRPK